MYFTVYIMTHCVRGKANLVYSNACLRYFFWYILHIHVHTHCTVQTVTEVFTIEPLAKHGHTGWRQMHFSPWGLVEVNGYNRLINMLSWFTSLVSIHWINQIHVICKLSSHSMYTAVQIILSCESGITEYSGNNAAQMTHKLTWWKSNWTLSSYLVKQLVVEFMAVVKDVFVCGVQACAHTVLHHLTRPGGALQLLDLKRPKWMKSINEWVFIGKYHFF